MALVLDMDGVIVDSNPLHAEAWRLYNRRFGIDAGEALAERMYGRRNDEIVRDFFGPRLSAEEVAVHGAAKEELYRKMLEFRLAETLVPGVREFLQRHAGQPVGLATNAEPANVDFILDRGGLRAHFRVVVDGHQVQHPKPQKPQGVDRRSMVQEKGLEPPLPFGNWILSPVRLPVSPLLHIYFEDIE